MYRKPAERWPALTRCRIHVHGGAVPAEKTHLLVIPFENVVQIVMMATGQSASAVCTVICSMPTRTGELG